MTRGSCRQGTGNESSKLPILLRQQGLQPNCLGTLSVLSIFTVVGVPLPFLRDDMPLDGTGTVAATFEHWSITSEDFILF